MLAAILSVFFFGWGENDMRVLFFVGRAGTRHTCPWFIAARLLIPTHYVESTLCVYLFRPRWISMEKKQQKQPIVSQGGRVSVAHKKQKLVPAIIDGDRRSIPIRRRPPHRHIKKKCIHIFFYRVLFFLLFMKGS
jgi:hypothetical protein